MRVYEVLDLDDSQLRRFLAVHEAGHAVLGVSGGGAVDYVRLAPDLGRGPIGEDPLVPPYGAAKIQWLPRTVKLGAHVLMAAGGAAAQQSWLEREGLSTPQRRWAVDAMSVHDRRNASDMVSGNGDELVFAGPHKQGAMLWSWYHQQATLALNRQWSIVQRLADALDERGHLDGPVVHDLLAGVENGMDWTALASTI